jgi:hypothetical protein
VEVIVPWDPERGIILSNSNDDDDAMDKSNYTQRIPQCFTSDGHTRRNGKCICNRIIASISDVTSEFLAIRNKLEYGYVHEAEEMLPRERLYDSLPGKIM